MGPQGARRIGKRTFEALREVARQHAVTSAEIENRERVFHCAKRVGDGLGIACWPGRSVTGIDGDVVVVVDV